MVTILQLETATQVCSAALSVNGETIAVKELAAQNIHAGSLTLFIREVMATAGLTYTDLDAVAVSKGPGSYTGLRIGVSTAKGLCFALDKPLIGIETLRMMAQGFLKTADNYTGLVCPMIDARRMEVFTGLYDHDLNEVLPVEAKIIEENSYQEQLKTQQLTFIGDGAMKCNTFIISPNAAFSDLNFNSASNMSLLAYNAFTTGHFEDVAYFEPYYLKDFVVTQAKKKV
ncbi:tRNA (adenosine(37)-N6)-threonylcarbamoyltransferase complex dimerization subunit type 1 TsaB [Pedobacter cryoconitis]|uniref:tRNA (adenosine(37)-N6)-threonylcarbamoyltransferase complex dimerization subunit type 1 TsaB n=1 Tax=Pedobacter cryoconitis TaxID=188932 RepID=UPI00161F2922|nr:tRNA (adenosine(37)-N6)-threonylcarbamoyltransferase complex dimerization subunit type 1 TsaB [Pedobacter cryoconitis]MBB5644261.1 tRNA threonylcarbamoyladenosine biosynthesis protein TsaB [Pedobacter cryoconitis]